MQVQSTNCCEYTHSVPVYMHAVPTPLTALVCSSVVGPPALYPPARLGGADAKGSSFFCVRVFSWASGVVARLEVHVLHYIYIVVGCLIWPFVNLWASRVLRVKLAFHGKAVTCPDFDICLSSPISRRSYVG